MLVGRLNGARGVGDAPAAPGPPAPGWLELKKGWRAFLDARGVLFLFDDAPFAPFEEGAFVSIAAHRADAEPLRVGVVVIEVPFSCPKGKW